MGDGEQVAVAFLLCLILLVVCEARRGPGGDLSNRTAESCWQIFALS